MILQLLIAATGNYGFFNLLSLVLCAAILDDGDWERLRDLAPRGRLPLASPTGSDPNSNGQARQWSLAHRVIVGSAGGVLLAATTEQLLERLWPGTEGPFPLPWIASQLEPLRSTNSYGLFSVMTTKRPEIIVEGSNDGVNWKPYHFRWKPGELDRSPRFTTPHMPRLDWQLWFAALSGDCRSERWFLQFEHRLLAGSPEVIALLRENPFPDQPPRFVRARLYLYRFTSWGSADWWARDDQGLFCPPIETKPPIER